MSCCLTKEIHQRAPRFAPDEERNCRVEGRRTKYSENYNVHSLRNGHVSSTCKVECVVMNASHDQMDRVDRARLVESGQMTSRCEQKLTSEMMKRPQQRRRTLRHESQHQVK